MRKIETCERFHRHLAAWVDGDIDPLLVLGPPGVGKSHAYKTGLGCRHHCRIPHERRDTAKDMTIPAGKRVVLRGMRGNHTPQRSNEAAWTVSGGHMQASSSECPPSLETGPA